MTSNAINPIRRQVLIACAATSAGCAAGPTSVLASDTEKASLGNIADVTTYAARPGSRSRDVAFSPDGAVWYCGQSDGTLTRLDPDDGALMPVDLGSGAAPHGVTLGPDNALWVTEGGQNAIARVDPQDNSVELMPLPEKFARANLNTGVFDHDGIYWFTGQNGVYGRVDPAKGNVEAWASPGGRGPYGITITRVPAESGQIPKVACGSVNGTAVRSASTIRLTAPGDNGNFPALAHARTRCMSTNWTGHG